MLAGGVGKEGLLAEGGGVDGQLVSCVAEAPPDAVGAERFRKTRLDAQAVVAGFDAQQILRGGIPVPGGRTGQPAVLALTRQRSVFPGHHLAIDIGLHLVQLLVRDEGGRNLAVMPPGVRSAAGEGLADDDPGIVVAEDAGVLLVTLRIGGNLPVFDPIAREGGIVEHQAVFAFQHPAGGIQGFVAHSLVGTDAGHRTPALAFDEDFSLIVFFRSYLAAEEIVGAEEPFAVPAIALDGRFHRSDSRLHGGDLRSRRADASEQFRIVPAFHHEQAGDHQRFGQAALGLVFGGLERFVWIVRETVEIEAVVPVGAPDARQAVGTEVIGDMVETDLQVFQQRLLAAGPVVERNRLVEDRKIARFLQIGDRPEEQPERIVAEPAADVVVAAAGQGLVLVIASAVGELGGGDVEDALPRPGGDLVDEAHQVLVGIAETHAAADAALEETGAATHIEGYHALVLVPDIDHPVQPGRSGTYAETAEDVVPVTAQAVKGRIGLFGRVESLQHRINFGLVDDSRRGEFLFGAFST